MHGSSDMPTAMGAMPRMACSMQVILELLHTGACAWRRDPNGQGHLLLVSSGRSLVHCCRPMLPLDGALDPMMSFRFGESYKRPLLGDFLSEGVGLYSSTDLMTWHNEGLVFNGTAQITGLPCDAPYRIERPKVKVSSHRWCRCRLYIHGSMRKTSMQQGSQHVAGGRLTQSWHADRVQQGVWALCAAVPCGHAKVLLPLCWRGVRDGDHRRALPGPSIGRVAADCSTCQT